MSKKKSTPVKSNKPVAKPKPKSKVKPVDHAETVVVETETAVADTLEAVIVDDSNPPESEQTSTSVVVKTRKIKEMAVTIEMESAIEEAKQCIKDEMNCKSSEHLGHMGS